MGFRRTDPPIESAKVPGTLTEALSRGDIDAVRRFNAERRDSARRAEELLRQAATDIGVAAALLKTSHPATARALFRLCDRIVKHRHRIEDGDAQ